MGNKAKLELAGHFDSAAALWQAQDYAAFNLPEEARKSLADKDLSETEKILRRCRNLGISVLCAGDPAYPRRLRNIADPPVVLYYRGNLAGLDSQPVVAVVGTRKASAYGMNAAKKLGYQRLGTAATAALEMAVVYAETMGTLICSGQMYKLP